MMGLTVSNSGVSDGTENGTYMVKDICPGPDSSTPTFFKPAGIKLFFIADDGITGRELWVYDTYRNAVAKWSSYQ